MVLYWTDRNLQHKVPLAFVVHWICMITTVRPRTRKLLALLLGLRLAHPAPTDKKEFYVKKTTGFRVTATMHRGAHSIIIFLPRPRDNLKATFSTGGTPYSFLIWSMAFVVSATIAFKSKVNVTHE